ncbi:MAG: flagellar protein FlaG [Candidatus Magnetomorum sp.]|nr:flagellar protein FlaG [Candidatus Magnetomorum sp.]
MNTVTPISTNNYNTTPAPPVVDYSKDAKQESPDKDFGKRIAEKYADSKVLTAKKFSTDSDHQQIVVKKRTEDIPSRDAKKEAPIEQPPQDVKDLLRTREGIESVAKVIEDYANDVHNVGLRFAVHEDTGKFVIRVIDEETKEVVREVPPENLLDLAAKMEEMMGMLYDEKV